MTLLAQTSRLAGRAALKRPLRSPFRPLPAFSASERASSFAALAPVVLASSPPSSWPVGAARHRRPCPTPPSARCLTAAPTSPPKIQLYQYHICPFCNIGKALLAYANVEYDAVEVNPLTKAELKPWSGDYKKVPIALIDDAQINGSEEIIDALLGQPHVEKALEARWAAECGRDDDDDEGTNTSVMALPQFQNSDSARKWMRFARDDLAALLYPNICGTLSESYDAFGYVKDVESFTTVQKMSIKYLGAVAMYFAASKIKTKRNITDARASLHAALDTFETEGLDGGRALYVSGTSRPDLGDIAVFGVLASVAGLDAHADAISLRGGPVQDWYDRMEQEVYGGVAR